MALAQNEGRVTLALRNVQDTAHASTPGVTIAQLLGSSGPVASPAQKQQKTPPSTGRAKVRKVSTPAVPIAALPPVPASPSAIPKAAEVQPTVPTHKVSVIRGASATDMVFVQDPNRGWLESPSKSDGTRKP